MNKSGNKRIVKPPVMTRRRFIGTTAAAGAAVAMLPSCASQVVTTGVERPKFNEVKLGTITYSYRGVDTDAESLLEHLVYAGLTEVELMGTPIEQYAGIPEVPRGSFGGFGGGGFPGGGFPPGMAPGGAPAEEEEPELTPEEIAEQEAAAAEAAAEREAALEEQRLWRLSPPMEKFAELRKMYNDAGVNIHIAKLDSALRTEDGAAYAFKVATALGAVGVTTELSMDTAVQVGPIAEDENSWLIFHNHMQPGEPGFSYDPYLSFTPNIMINFDAGHAFGSSGVHPNEYIEKYHDRMASIHMKDKTGPDNEQPNQNRPWGEGETPIADILLLLKKELWPIYVDIELEYQVPEGSTSVEEVKKCADYMRDILA